MSNLIIDTKVLVSTPCVVIYSILFFSHSKQELFILYKRFIFCILYKHNNIQTRITCSISFLSFHNIKSSLFAIKVSVIHLALLKKKKKIKILHVHVLSKSIGFGIFFLQDKINANFYSINY